MGANFSSTPTSKAEAPPSPSYDLNTSDFYTILQIDRDATSEQIRRAYLKRAIETHPDKNPDDEVGATRRFQIVKKAYDVLINFESRFSYDLNPTPFHRDLQTDDDDDSHSSTKHNTPGSWNDSDYINDPYEEVPNPNNPNNTPFTGTFNLFETLGLGLNTLFSYLGFTTNTSPPSQNTFTPLFLNTPENISLNDIYNFILSIPTFTWTSNECIPFNAYLLTRTFFHKLALDEASFGSRHQRPIPTFGNAQSIYSRSTYTDQERQFGINTRNPEIHLFYDYWLKYKTTKRFEWIKPFCCPCGYSGCNRSAIVNKQIQEDIRTTCNEMIKFCITLLLDIDPRYQTHLERRQSGLYCATTEQKLDERQRRKEKKKNRKRAKKNKW